MWQVTPQTAVWSKGMKGWRPLQVRPSISQNIAVAATEREAAWSAAVYVMGAHTLR